MLFVHICAHGPLPPFDAHSFTSENDYVVNKTLALLLQPLVSRAAGIDSPIQVVLSEVRR